MAHRRNFFLFFFLSLPSNVSGGREGLRWKVFLFVPETIKNSSFFQGNKIMGIMLNLHLVPHPLVLPKYIKNGPSLGSSISGMMWQKSTAIKRLNPNILISVCLLSYPSPGSETMVLRTASLEQMWTRIFKTYLLVQEATALIQVINVLRTTCFSRWSSPFFGKSETPSFCESFLSSKNLILCQLVGNKWYGWEFTATLINIFSLVFAVQFSDL